VVVYKRKFKITSQFLLLNLDLFLKVAIYQPIKSND